MPGHRGRIVKVIPVYDQKRAGDLISEGIALEEQKTPTEQVGKYHAKGLSGVNRELFL